MRFTNEQLLELLKKENELFPFTYTDRKKTIIEMLRIRNVKLP